MYPTPNAQFAPTWGNAMGHPSYYPMPAYSPWGQSSYYAPSAGPQQPRYSYDWSQRPPSYVAPQPKLPPPPTIQNPVTLNTADDIFQKTISTPPPAPKKITVEEKPRVIETPAPKPSTKPVSAPKTTTATSKPGSKKATVVDKAPAQDLEERVGRMLAEYLRGQNWEQYVPPEILTKIQAGTIENPDQAVLEIQKYALMKAGDQIPGVGRIRRSVDWLHNLFSWGKKNPPTTPV